MADKKISALTAATTIVDGSEVVPIVQSATTKKSTLTIIKEWLATFFLGSPISLTLAAAQTLAASEAGIIVDQTYLITDIGSTHSGLSGLKIKGAIIINGAGDSVYGFSTKAKVYHNALKVELDCDYDIASDKLITSILHKFKIIDSNGTPELKVLKSDTPAVTFTIGYVGSDTPYRITASSEIWDTDNSKVGGYSFRSAVGEPNLSYGFFESTTQFQIAIFNPLSLTDEPKASTVGATFSIITTIES